VGRIDLAFALVIAERLGKAIRTVVFSEFPALAWIGTALWGAVLGMQESTLRAAVGDLVKTRKATAYGIFNAAYGLALLAGGSFLSLIYERSVPLLVAYGWRRR
jgi:hypothetical protein